MTEPTLRCACCNAEMTEAEAVPPPEGATLYYHRSFRQCVRVAMANLPTLRSYINSEQEHDREYAQAMCQEYGLSYQPARQIIVLEMVAEQEANEPLRARRRKGKTP